MRWCMPTPLHAVVASEADALQRCNTAVALADTAAIKFSCVAGASSCKQHVADGDAELTSQGGAC